MVQMLSMQTACCMLHVSLGATDGEANDSQQPGKRIRSRVKYPEIAGGRRVRAASNQLGILPLLH